MTNFKVDFRFPKWQNYLHVYLLFVIFAIRPCWAYDEDENWNMSLQIGTHLPQITALRSGLLKSPMIGQGTLNPENAQEGEDVIADFHLPSPLSGRFNAAKSAIRFQWNNASPVSMTFGFATWEATAYGNTNVVFPIQGTLENALYERKISLTYTEYHIGAIAKAFQQNNFTIYGRMSFDEIFDIDYREDLTFSFKQGTDEAYQRILVLKAQTASLFSSTFGVGSEWKYSKVVTFSAELSYLFSLEKVKLQNAEFSHNILLRDQLNLNDLLYPFGSNQNREVTYLPEDITQEQIDAGETYKPMNLSFNGWQFMLSMNIYY